MRSRPGRDPWPGIFATALLALFLAGWAPRQADAATVAPLNSHVTTRTAAGPTIRFADVDHVLAPPDRLPQSGWARDKLPKIYRLQATHWRVGDDHTIWGRLRFDRSALGADPLALYTIDTRNQFVVYVNGAEVFRNFARLGDHHLAWYRPYLAPIPASALKPGVNEIVIRATSAESVGVGQVIIGPHSAVRDHYRSEWFWRITAPTFTNGAMLVLGAFALLLWLGRRGEVELLYLALSTALWFARNYQYFGEQTPFNQPIFNAWTEYETYFGSVAAFAFYAEFVKLPNRRTIIGALFALGVLLTGLHSVFWLPNTILYVPSTLIAFSMAVLGLRDLRRNWSVEHFILAAVMLLMPIAGLYDLVLYSGRTIVPGGDFYLAVFSGFFYCLAFLTSFGKRALDAFFALGDANATLAQRVAETRAELAASEAARQQLMVGKAVAGERERLMREMHDGIGSNLITALAIAEKQAQPPETIRTLRRALSDLKITVDSLEDVNGDLIALLGNLRHRMTADLRQAGVACKWEVTPCGPLPWLDATNALHALRIFQEAIGNALAHSGATELRIGCRETDRDGVAGIATHIADNGRGFDPASLDASGKGLANIRSRALALHGALECQTEQGVGTVVTLWLPYGRDTPR